MLPRLAGRGVHGSREEAGRLADGPHDSDTPQETKVEKYMIDNLPVMLILFGLAGFTFWFGRSKTRGYDAQASAAAPVVVAPPPAAAGETGVARYLKSLPEPAAPAPKAVEATPSETGVARYLKTLPEPPVVTGVTRYLRDLPPPPVLTGVAKYLKEIATETAASVPETGVAKYLKNLPMPEFPPKQKSSVDRYLSSMPPPVRESGVAKYLKGIEQR